MVPKTEANSSQQAARKQRNIYIYLGNYQFIQISKGID